MKNTKELVGASTSMLVLTLLAQEATYGYLLIRKINAAADGLFRWNEGTIYPVLHKLELDGSIRAQWQQADTGRDRKYYYITAQGRDALTEAKQQWDGFHNLVHRIAEANNG
jgi:PadR family transcriptional regulator PadR